MNAKLLLDKLEKITTWKRREQRAPNKPLLLLYALARIEQGKTRLFKYSEVHEPLGNLLREFGPPRTVVHPEYPFWRLENDGVWQVAWPPPLQVRERRTQDVSAATLMEEEVEAGFPPQVQKLLEKDPDLRRRVARMLLDAHFPTTLHEDIQSAVGLDTEWETTRRRVRDPEFRSKVLAAWRNRCGVCGFDVRLGRTSLALDAAHIRWKQAGGPDVENNGLALCALHHRLFDRGAFTVQPATRKAEQGPMEVLVSDLTAGTRGLQESLMRFHGSGLLLPEKEDQRPESAHLLWHRKEVFRGPAHDSAGPG
jgi:putative restriction endonuclease